MNNYRHRVSGRQRTKSAATSDNPGMETTSSKTSSSKISSSKTSTSKITLPKFHDIEQAKPFDIHLLFENNQPFKKTIHFMILDKSVSAIKSDLLPIFTKRHTSLGNSSMTLMLCGKLLARKSELTEFTKEEMLIETNIRVHTNNRNVVGRRIDQNFQKGEALYLCSGCLMKEKIFLVLMVSDSPNYKRHTCVHLSRRRKSLDRICEGKESSTTDFEQSTWTKTSHTPVVVSRSNTITSKYTVVSKDSGASKSTNASKSTTMVSTASKPESKKSGSSKKSSFSSKSVPNDSNIENMISQADNKPVDADMPQKLASKPSKFEKVDSQYVQCGSVVTSMLEEEQADSSNNEIEIKIGEFESEKTRIHGVNSAHAEQTVAEEVEDSVGDETESENEESDDPVIEKTTTGTGMNDLEDSSDSSCVSSSSDADTTVVNDELLRVSSASINAAIMDKLTEYETTLRNSQKQKDKIAANLINQAMAVLKMKKSVK